MYILMFQPLIDKILSIGHKIQKRYNTKFHFIFNKHLVHPR